jgi:peptidoglycan/xylan/chitin deacetylase (PgdA/CDA1 family)
VAVTFDDGFRSVIEHALPILSLHGFVGTVFVATDHVGRDAPMDWPVIDRWIGGPHEHELLPLSWAELARLAAAGWEIASHTRSHPRLTELDDATLREELAGSREECEQRLGVSCRSLAYPYGVVDHRVMVATRRAGYLAGAALPARIHRVHRYRWPRVGVWPNDPPRVWEAKLSPLARRRLDLRTGVSSAVPQWRFGTP